MVGATYSIDARVKLFPHRLVNNILRLRVANIETAPSQEILDRFSRNKIYTDLHTIYLLKITEVKPQLYFFCKYTCMKKGHKKVEVG
jgi:hypothetical protein